MTGKRAIPLLNVRPVLLGAATPYAQPQNRHLPEVASDPANARSRDKTCGGKDRAFSSIFGTDEALPPNVAPGGEWPLGGDIPCFGVSRKSGARRAALPPCAAG